MFKAMENKWEMWERNELETKEPLWYCVRDVERVQWFELSGVFEWVYVV